MSTHPRVHSVWPRNGQNKSGILQDQQISLIFEEVGNQLLLKLMGKIPYFQIKTKFAEIWKFYLK